MRFCDNCGQGNPDDATFCAQCGVTMEAQANPPGASPGGPEVTSGGPPQPPPPPGTPIQPIAGPPPGGPPPVGPPGISPGPPPGVPPYPTQYAAPPPRVETEAMAVASLALGIAGWFICPLLGILALVFGYMARTRIKESGGRLEGDGLALAGIILGWIQIALTLVGIIIIIIIAATAGFSSTTMLVPLQVAVVPMQVAMLVV